jgi:hypothetical protein
MDVDPIHVPEKAALHSCGDRGRELGELRGIRGEGLVSRVVGVNRIALPRYGMDKRRMAEQYLLEVWMAAGPADKIGIG